MGGQVGGGRRKSKLNTLWSAPDVRKKKEKVETSGGKAMHCNGDWRDRDRACKRNGWEKGKCGGSQRNWNGIARKEGVVVMAK